MAEALPAGPPEGHVAVAVPPLDSEASEARPESPAKSALRRGGDRGSGKRISLDLPDDVPERDEPPAVSKSQSTVSRQMSRQMSRQGSLATMGAVKTRSERPSFAALQVEEKPAITRQQLLRYVALQEWSRWGLIKAPLAVSTWLVLILIMIFTSYTETSFFVRQAMTDYVANVTADMSRGNPFDRIISQDLAAADTGVRCRCSCAVEKTQALCSAGAEGRATEFRATFPLNTLASLRQRAGFQATPGAAGLPRRLDDLRTQSDAWFWIQHGLLPEFWKEEPLGTPVDFPTLLAEVPPNATKNLGVVLHWSQFVGGIRMRQQRLMEGRCTIDERITNRYGRICHQTQPAVEPFGPGLQSFTEGFIPELRKKGAFDVHFDFEYDIAVATEKMEHVLEKHRWLDSSSESLALQAAFFNAQADPPLLGVLEVTFSFQRGGAMKKDIRVQTIPTKSYNSTFELILFIVWFGLLLCMFSKQLRKVVRYFRSPVGDKPVMCDIWNLGDWATLAFSFGLALNYMLLASEIDYTAKQAAAIPPAPKIEEATTTMIRAYHESWDRVLDMILDINAWGVTNRILLFAYSLVLTFQFLQIFRAQPKLAELGRVMINSSADLIHFGVVFLVLFLNFAFGGFMIFGMYLEEWSTGVGAINSSLQVLFGLVDLERMFDIAPKSTVIWFVAFVCCLTFVMLNLLVAIAVDNFAHVKAKGGTTCGIFSQMGFAIRDQSQRGWGKALCCCCPLRRCKSNPTVPSHKVLLQEMLLRCGFTAKEKHDFEGSVIRGKYIRQSIEKAAFAAETDDATDILMARQQPVEEDLDDLGVDEGYAAALQKETARYVEQDYDYEEKREGQLREIVSIGYDIMTDMRERISRCQDYAGEEMSGLARRLEALEIVVHRSLEELVKIAEGANISTKGEPTLSLKGKARMATTVSNLRSLDATTKSKGMMTGSLTSVLDKLADVAQEPPKKKKIPASVDPSTFQVKVRTSNQPPPEPPKTAVSSWHRTAQRVGVAGKRVLVSAREEWSKR